METEKNSESENGEYFSDGIAVYEIEIEEQAGILIQYVTDKSMSNFVMDEESTSAAISSSSTSLKEDLDAESTQDSAKSDILETEGTNDLCAVSSVFSLNKNDDQPSLSLYTEDMNVSITPCSVIDASVPENRGELAKNSEEIGIELQLPFLKSSSTTPLQNKSLSSINLLPSPTKLNMVPSILNRTKILQKSPSILSSAALNSPSLEGEGNTTDTSCSSPTMVAKELVPRKVSVLGKEQAKRRLQAFSMTKQALQKSPLAKKIVKPTKQLQDSGGADTEKKVETNAKRAAKKAMLPNEKAKAVIEEIEEMKKVETAYFSALKEGLFNNTASASAIKERIYRNRRSSAYERSRSRERSYSRERNFNRGRGRNRSKRYSTNSSSNSAKKKKYQHQKRSRSAESVEHEKVSRKKVITYPKSWVELKKNNLSLEEVLKIKPEDSSKPVDFRKQVASLVTFEGHSPQKYDLIVKAVQGPDKTCPQEYLNYTISQPSVSFCENTMFAPNLYFHKNRILSEISSDRLDHINRIMNAGKPKSRMRTTNSEQKWLLRDNYLKESEISAECHILEKDIGIGLAILKCYTEDEDEDEEEMNSNLNKRIKGEEAMEVDECEGISKSKKKSKKSEKTKLKKKDALKKKSKDEKRTTKERSEEKTSSIEERLQKLSTERVSADSFDYVESERDGSGRKSKSTSVDRNVNKSLIDNSEDSRKADKKTKRKKEKEMRTIKKVVEIAKDILGKHYDVEQNDYEITTNLQSHTSLNPVDNYDSDSDKRELNYRKYDKKKHKIDIISDKYFNENVAETENIKYQIEATAAKDVISNICEAENRKPRKEVIPVKEFVSKVVKPEKNNVRGEVIPAKEFANVELEKSDPINKTRLNEFETIAAVEDFAKDDKETNDTPRTEEYHSNWEGDDELAMFETQGSGRKEKTKSLHRSGWESDEDTVHRDNRKQQHSKSREERHRKDVEIGRENRRSIDRDFSLYCNPHRDDKWDERKSFERRSNSQENKSNKHVEMKYDEDKKAGVRIRNRERLDSFETKSHKNVEAKYEEERRSKSRVRSRERSNSHEKKSRRSVDIKYEEERRRNVRLHSKDRERRNDTTGTYRKSNERKMEKETHFEKRKDDRFNWEDDEMPTTVERESEEKRQRDKSWDNDEKSYPRKKVDPVTKFEQYYNDWEDEDQFEIETKNKWAEYQTEISLSLPIDKKQLSCRSIEKKDVKVKTERSEISLSPPIDHRFKSHSVAGTKVPKHEKDVSLSPPIVHKHSGPSSDVKVTRYDDDDMDISFSPPIEHGRSNSADTGHENEKNITLTVNEEKKLDNEDAKKQENRHQCTPTQKLEKKVGDKFESDKLTPKHNVTSLAIKEIPVPPIPSLASPASLKNKDPDSSKLVSEYEEFMKAVSGDVDIAIEAQITMPTKTKAQKKLIVERDDEEKVDTSKEIKSPEQAKKKKSSKKDSSSSSSSSSYSSDSGSSSDESSLSSSSESEDSHEEDELTESNKSTLLDVENAQKATKDWVNEFSLETQDYDLTDIELPSSITSNIPLPDQNIMKIVLKEEETQSPESSTTNSNMPSPRKSRPLIPIRFLTAESRKQATSSPVNQTNTGFGIFETRDVLTPTDSPKVSSTNINESVPKLEEDARSEQVVNRKRHFSWASTSTPAKRLLLEETKEHEDELDEDFTDKFLKKPEEDVPENLALPSKDVEKSHDVKAPEGTPKVKKDIQKESDASGHAERHSNAESRSKDHKERKPASKESLDRSKQQERTPRSVSGERRGRGLGASTEKRREKGRRSRDRFNERSRRSRSRSYEKSGRFGGGRRSLRRTRSRDRGRRQRRERSRSRSLERRNERRNRRNTRSPEKDRRTLSPGHTRSHESSEYNNPYMDIVKSPVNSPLDGFKRSLADSTISDSDLLLQRHNSEEYNETSPRYGSNNPQYYPPHIVHPAVARTQQQPSMGGSQSVGSPSSPKRIPLDDRINQVLGIDKDPPKQIGTVYGQHGPQQHHQYNYAPNYYEQQQYGQQYSAGNYDQYNNLKVVQHTPTHYPSPYPPTYSAQSAPSTPYSHLAAPKVVQVGNVLQVVPTEGIMSTLPPLPSRPPPASPSISKGTPEGAPKVVQVGNMLQIVPQAITMSTEKSTPAASSPMMPVASQTILPPNKESPVINIQHKNSEQLVAERRAEREKRRLEREKRRKDKEKKRKEKDKRKQLKIKLKTENMIKRALLLETEGAMALGEPSEPDLLDPEEGSPLIASWPPPPIVLPATSLKSAGKGILVNHDYSSEDVKPKSEEKKSVKFADGICPGEGTSPSGGEDLPSPPPPTTKLPKEKKFKKIKPKIPKINKKKKIKVKIIRTQPQPEDDSEEDNLPPPSPPPGSPPPHLFPPRIKTHTINNIHPSHPPEMPQQTQLQQFSYHPSGYPSNLASVIMYPGPQPPSHVPPHNHPLGLPPPHMSHSPSPSTQGYIAASHPPVYPMQGHSSQHGLHQTQHPPALPPQGAHLNRNY